MSSPARLNHGRFCGLSQLTGVLLVVWLILVAVSPRIPVDLDLDRRSDIRLQELLFFVLLPLATFLAVKNRFRFRSPWFPWFSISALLSTVTLTAKVLFFPPSNQLLALGYAYRFLIFFAIAFVVSTMAVSATSKLTKWLLIAINVTLVINATHIMVRGIRGDNAQILLYDGRLQPLYSPGLVGEPNALAAGIFFIFVMSVNASYVLVKGRHQRAAFLMLVIAAASVYFTNNRSAFLGVLVLLTVFLICLAWQRRIRVAAVTALGVLALGVSFFLVNWRGRFESTSDEISIGRLPNWQSSWALLRDSPLIGWSLGEVEPHQAFLRLAGELGALGLLAIMLLFLRILTKKSDEVPGSLHSGLTYMTEKEFIGGRLWIFVTKIFLLVLLAMGVLTDSLTPVLSWDLLAFCVGMAWFSYAQQEHRYPALGRVTTEGKALEIGRR